MRIILTFILFTQVIIAQNINGIVLDSKTKEPIENVTVYFKKGNIGTISNVFGKFDFNITSKTTKFDSLQFSFVGYHTKVISLTTFKNNNTTVYLSQKIEGLDQVEVNSSKDLKRALKFKTLASLKSRVYAFGSQLIGDSIYVVSGNSSYLEDTGKKALQEVSSIPNATLEDFIRAMRFGFSYQGYSDKLQIYDLKRDTWLVSDTEFRKRAFHNLNIYKNSLYSFGGKRLSMYKKREYLEDKVEVFDMASKQIIVDGTNPHQAINFASCTYEDNIIVMGGSTELLDNGTKVFTNAAHIYNISSGLWYELTNMTTAKETQGVIINNIIYLIGGDDGKPLKTIESYNLKTGLWTNEGDLFTGMQRPGLTTHDNNIYIFDNEKLLIYNTINKTLEEFEIFLKLKNAKLHYYKNKLYIVGGYTENSHTTAAQSGVYEINMNDFEKTKSNNFKLTN